MFAHGREITCPSVDGYLSKKTATLTITIKATVITAKMQEAMQSDKMIQPRAVSYTHLTLQTN